MEWGLSSEARSSLSSEAESVGAVAGVVWVEMGSELVELVGMLVDLMLKSIQNTEAAVLCTKFLICEFEK